MIKILLNFIVMIHFTKNNSYDNFFFWKNVAWKSIYLTFYFAFEFHDSNAQFPAQRAQHFEPTTDLYICIGISGLASLE